MAETYEAGLDVADGTRAGAAELSAAIDACCLALEDGWSSPGQAGRLVRILGRFAEFSATGFGVLSLDGVTADIAASFVWANSAGADPPTTAQLHLRRTALRLLFRTARQHGFAVGDPTMDLALPPRSPLSTRPLTDDEVTLCRSHAYWSLSDSRRASAWALAEASCRSSELALITVGDVDLEFARVWVHGGRTTTPRWGELTEWGALQVRRRTSELGDDPARRLVYAGKAGGESGQVSSCVAIIDVLTRAGLAAEPDVRPASVAAWAGRQVLTETGRIDLAARRLGMSSLDRTARFIAWDWNIDESDGPK